MRIPMNPAVQQALDAGRMAAQKSQSAGMKAGGHEDFAQMLMDVIKDVNDGQLNAEQMRDDFISGRRPVEIQDVMIALEKASTQMQLTMAVRNKVLEAYQEVMRMQI